MASPTMEEFAALKTKVEAAEGKFQDVTARIDTQQQMFELLRNVQIKGNWQRQPLKRSAKKK